LLESRNIKSGKTNIGRMAGKQKSRRGNNQGGIDGNKLKEYESWEKAYEVVKDVLE